MPPMSEMPYTTLPAVPESVTATSVLCRLVDGLSFRYRWATEGLEDADLAYRPSDDGMSLGEVMAHIHVLGSWVAASLGAAGRPKGPTYGEVMEGEPAPSEHDALRRETLAVFARVRGHLEALGEEGLATVTLTGSLKAEPEPFWCMINGPLADALTHVGQVAVWRRALGKPAPRADVFRGNPPRARGATS